MGTQLMPSSHDSSNIKLGVDITDLEQAKLEERKKFVNDFLNGVSLILSDPISGEGLLKYISSVIRDFNLHNIDKRDVLSEAVMRGLDSISKKHEQILNPIGWLRIATNLILLEESRKISKSYQLSKENLERLCHSDDEEESLSEDPGRALKAFHSLSNGEKRIIIYKLFQGKNYAEINRLSPYQKCSQDSIRQQYSRAIKKLRSAFFS
jgi:DNA-directed RNA polymerase specialized sigma24 family protein